MEAHGFFKLYRATVPDFLANKSVTLRKAFCYFVNPNLHGPHRGLFHQYIPIIIPRSFQDAPSSLQPLGIP